VYDGERGSARVAVALALMTPAARAQTAQSTRVTVCLDGTTTTDVSSRACVRHSGINVDATRRLRAQRTNTTSYGVYDARGNVINGNQIPCGDGTYSTTGIHGCDARGGIASTTTQIRCTDGTLTAGGIHACATHGGVSSAQTNGQYNNGQYNSAINARNDRAESARRLREERAAIRSGATAKCEDGTFSKAASRRGACVQHGGIAAWYGKRQ
jgi:hypothetical protein